MFEVPSLGRHCQWRAEAVGCPVPTRILDAPENIFHSSRKISPKCFTFSHQLSHFTKIGFLDAPLSAESCPVTTFFSSFLSMYTYIFYKPWPLGCPPGWMPGAVAPSAPPLHATGRCSIALSMTLPTQR